ncbi:MAG: SGNH/GDSL hydrolase family protein [Microthrixaceae bacterium]
MSLRARLRAPLAGLALAAVTTALITPIARADDPVDTPTPVYIALGDSYTAAPLSSKPVGKWGGDGPGYSNPNDPYTCGRSDRNYPHLIAQHLGLYDPNDLTQEIGEHPVHPGFIDISCGSARTRHMTEPQGGLPGGGEAPPQFDAFDRVGDDEIVKLVSIGIGGNDLGFGELTDKCVQAPHMPGGTPCHVYYENDGDDLLRARLVTLRTRLDDVLAEIHRLAPQAEVLVYGYPALLPEHRDAPVPELQDGCYPYIPILPADAAYLREVEKDLNRTIEQAATANDAHYVDWYTPSMGHDMCQPPGLAWVNGVVLAPPSYPVHPNVLGSMGAAEAGIDVLAGIDGFSFVTP